MAVAQVPFRAVISVNLVITRQCMLQECPDRGSGKGPHRNGQGRCLASMLRVKVITNMRARPSSGYSPKYARIALG